MVDRRAQGQVGALSQDPGEVQGDGGLITCGQSLEQRARHFW